MNLVETWLNLGTSFSVVRSHTVVAVVALVIYTVIFIYVNCLSEGSSSDQEVATGLKTFMGVLSQTFIGLWSDDDKRIFKS